MDKKTKEVWAKRDDKVEKEIKDDIDGEGIKSVHALVMHTLRRASQSADRLSTRIWWLNLILVFLGTLGLIIAALGVFCK